MAHRKRDLVLSGAMAALIGFPTLLSGTCAAGVRAVCGLGEVRQPPPHNHGEVMVVQPGVPELPTEERFGGEQPISLADAIGMGAGFGVVKEQGASQSA